MLAAALVLLAVAASAQTFPCRLDALPQRPPLVLIGENHCDPGSRAVKEDAWKRAALGELAMGQEGLFPGDEPIFLKSRGLPDGPDALVFGIEQPFSHGLILSYFAGSSGKVCERTVEDAVYSDVRGMNDNPTLRMAWKVTFDEEGGHALLRRSRAARLIDDATRGFRVSRAQFDALTPEEHADLLRLLREVNNVYVDAANHQLAALGLSQALTPLPLDLHEPPLPEERQQLHAAHESIEAVILPVRNLMMAANLERVYCSVAPSGRAVVAVVGSQHLPGLVALLEAASGGTLSVSTHDSERDPSGGLSLLASLAARRAPTRSIGAAPSLSAPDWR